MPIPDIDDALTPFPPPDSEGPDLDVTTFTPQRAVHGFDDAPTTFPIANTTGAQVPVAANGSDSESGPLTIGQHFGRYTIVRLLGVGGMGAVYQAWDQELEVIVALKVIRPEALRDPLAEQEIERRFKRELLLARQVTHKNVVRIHDLGEIDGIKYITMSYVAGTDLASLVKQVGRLPVPKTLRIIRSIVSGLIAAHAAGVVHRDLKPANVMIDTEGDALIMDFGIARSTGGSSSLPVPALIGTPSNVWRSMVAHAEATMAGLIVGTVEYMAPEQARGEPVDQRADVYATGLILYDLLVGRRRTEHAESAVAELDARMEGMLPPLRSLATEVPEALAAVVARAVEPDPNKRYQTTTELADDLDRLDGNGEPLPVRRVVGLPLLVAVVTLLLAVSVGTWWYSRQSVPAPPHAPVSVVIADFQNLTGDPTFDRILEPMLKRALEGAGFISAYDRNGIRRTLGVEPPAQLDAVTARELAVKQGLGVVLSGSINRQGTGYGVSIKASQTVTGNDITSVSERASSKEQVLGTATKLVTAVRQALGDETSESAQIFAMASVSATSLDVVRHYAAAQEAASNNKFEEARQSILKAVALDPNFGLGYQVLSGISRNLGRLQDAERYINEALRHLDGMTERERFTTRGMFYRVTGDYQQCVKEYGELIGRYAADVVARNQVALCASKLRDLRRAQDEMRRVVEIVPKRVVFRDNLALYANYAGDFQTAEQQALSVQEPDAYAALALAFSQLGQSQVSQALETYQKLGTIDAQGASFAASGLGDVATYEGRFSDAVRILEQGAAADSTAKNPDRAATKFAALAYAHLQRGQTRSGVTAAERALVNSKEVKIRFLAARIYVEAGESAKARGLMTGLAAELQSEPQAYAKIVEGGIALKDGDARRAIKLLTEANGLLDTWIGHFDLGRAYLEAEQFPQADSEFDRCLKRRGEALSLFLDEEPTYGYLPTVYYYQGRVREALHSAGFAESYRTYLAIRGKAGEDPLLREVRRRAGA
jgi:serine/threonine protein kinase/tetratricopeptide (TPR) repeat protein